MSVRILQSALVAVAVSALPAMAITVAQNPVTVSVQELQAEVRAKGALRQVASTASQTADLAFLLNRLSGDPGAANTEARAADLMQLRDAVRHMRLDLRAISTDSGALTPWQQQAMDLVTPLLRDAAARADHAIRYYGENPRALWNPEFRGDAGRIQQDSERIARILRNLLRYDRLRDRELRVEERILEAGM